ncbi:hypothetical protein GSY71_08545 [Pusillimonas sp. TS35]|uniref:hypothetical protein n=1 Tax=Paracandidimonas lactea TaxID=2895524 RepID=UPI0013700F20|nr:hypothetical protein [Paracandidimonas lactea]MYN13191.1 hypothetical protein [Pusillimonas sp. TS35]
MQSSSRRAFLTGRRALSDPWQAFCQAMRRNVEGSFFELDTHGGAPAARLVPKQPGDVRKARALCERHAVILALDGVPGAARLDDEAVLWVDPGRALGRCERLEPGSPQWFVQPGCLLGELEAAGLTAFADLPCHISVAAWLADRTLCDWPSGQTHESGIVHASVLLGDGEVVTLGPFGEHNRKPLDGIRLQQLIPALFQLSTQAAGRACRAQPAWPARYRLDALAPVDGQAVNLAHLLLGHGGDLGWVEWLVIDERLARPLAEQPYDARYAAGRAVALGLEAEAGELDAAVKSLFDPHCRLSHPGQSL